MQSKNSLNGIAPSRDYRSARPWWSDIEYTWNRGTSHEEQSTSALVQCAALHTKQPTAAYSARILAAGIRRVKGVKKLGVRLGNWLTAEQGNALWQAPDPARLRGKRDRALLAILLACGLRRHEIAELTVDHLQQREEHWAIVDLVGKGGHIRTIPVHPLR
jgi:integrase